MSREVIKGRDGFTTLGFYDPKRNETFDKDGFTTIAHGNVLSGLIYEKR